jgi:hypothetical protein
MLAETGRPIFSKNWSKGQQKVVSKNFRRQFLEKLDKK